MQNNAPPIVLPVMDLKRGQVVLGVGGQRDRYQPIQSCLVESPHPGKVARAICDAAGCKDVYVADLDAIAGEHPDWNSYATIQNQGVDLWLDAGVGDIAAMSRLLERLTCRVIVAFESLPTLRSLEKLIARFPSHDFVFSLDLRDGLPVTNDLAASKLSAETVASVVVDAGIQTMIVLDVAAVGSGKATTIDLCRQIKSRHVDLELISGGGVSDHRDVIRFQDAGCDRVLVASALHAGTLGVA